MKTKEYYIKKHREVWKWLAENPDKEKAQWPGWKPGEHIANDCFLCCYVDKLENNSCKNCPLDWTITKECMDTLPTLSYYFLYEEALSPKLKTEYAKIIANLPEKKEI
jgi:hypothetical protein